MAGSLSSILFYRQWRYRCRRQIRVESFYRNFPATLSLLPPDRDVFPPISGRGTAGAGHCQHVVSPRVADVPGTCNFNLLGLPFSREAGIASCERLTSRAACLPTIAGILGGNTVTSSAQYDTIASRSRVLNALDQAEVRIADRSFVVGARIPY